MNVDELLKDVVKSFNSPPKEIVFIISGIFVIIGLILIIGVIKRIIDRYKFALAANKRFEKYIVKYSLTKYERNLVDRMSGLLKNPLKKYLLLINPHTFNTCFHLLSSREDVDEQIRTSIYKKLGFIRYDPHKTPSSSNDIAEGTPAKLINKDRDNAINGKVIRHLPDAVVFVSLENHKGFLNEDAVILFTHNYTGLYGFKTRVIKNENKAIYLANSENIVKIQRREYFRKNIHLPILLRREGSEDDPDDAYIQDLSAGGLSVTNPGKKYLKGDDLSLFFHEETDKEFHLYGEVVRVSGYFKILHIKFGHVKKGERDRLVGFVQGEHPA
ncbi:MAG: PilZ domain-containing protein [Spirochaetales bacterium]|nr:PilZ domain-containing protein [Spirochaetales bacterium]